MSKKLHLLEAYGIELEYMIVDRESLEVRPIADELIRHFAGEIQDDYEMGEITISNELVLHVIELKCTNPSSDLIRMENAFKEAIHKINKVLKDHFNARLMPGAAHPWMDPAKQTFLWPHGNSEVYERYNQMFNCSGHGWSNLQSMHINLPFANDEEFALLHTACRLLLPLMPALSASSPILDGAYTGMHDKRLDYYRKNQSVIPSIAGNVIPENILNEKAYSEKIYKKIEEDIADFNSDGILNPIWMNSRGIIARFDRGSIEIRILDIQECPANDLAIAFLIIKSISTLIDEIKTREYDKYNISNQILIDLFINCIENSQTCEIADQDYLKVFGINEKKILAVDFWKFLRNRVEKAFPEESSHWNERLNIILNEGNLAMRILDIANNEFGKANLKLIYQEMSQDLEENRSFGL